MPGDMRFVLVSKDSAFCEAIEKGMKPYPFKVDVVSEAAKVKRNRTTLALVDMDTVTDALLLEALRDTLVILTAYKQASAKYLLRGNIRDFVPKPLQLKGAHINHYLSLIVGRLTTLLSQPAQLDYKKVFKTVPMGSGKKVIAIASSTGGVEAVEKVISHFPENIPPVLLVQHMPSGFTKLFANRLNGSHKINIKEAQSGDYLLQGEMLIAPAGTHMRLVQKQGKLAVDCYLGTKVNGVMPAADILFESVAEIVRGNAIGVVLTGMGSDGARGLMRMRGSGARTIGQNEESCVVYGMPKVAKDLGAVEQELPLDKIGSKILEWAL